jgi:hypothetical protein
MSAVDISSPPSIAQARQLAWEQSVSAERPSLKQEFARRYRPAEAAEAVRNEITGTIRDLVEKAPGGNRKARLTAAARSLGIAVGRVTDFFYGEARRVDAHEADRIRDHARQAEYRELARLETEYAALRAKLVAAAPGGLAALCPPALEAPTASSIEQSEACPARR